MAKIYQLLFILLLSTCSIAQTYPFSYNQMRYGSIFLTDSVRNKQLFRPKSGEIFYGRNALDLVRGEKNYVLFENSYSSRGLLKKTTYYDHEHRELETVTYEYNAGNWLSNTSWHIFRDGHWIELRSTCYDYVFSFTMNTARMSFEASRTPIQITVTTENCSPMPEKWLNTTMVYTDLVWASEDLRQLESYKVRELRNPGGEVLRNQYIEFHYSDSGYNQTVYNITEENDEKIPLERMFVRKGKSAELLSKQVKYYNPHEDSFITYQSYYFVQNGPTLQPFDEIAYVKNKNGTNIFRPAIRYVYRKEPTLSNTGVSSGNNLLSIYPQLARNLLNINIPDIEIRIGQIQIFSIQGSRLGQFFVEKDEAGSNKEVDISGYPPGTYIVIFNSGKTIHTGKFIKGE